MKTLLTVGCVAMVAPLFGQTVSSTITRNYGPAARPVLITEEPPAEKLTPPVRTGRTLEFAPLDSAAVTKATKLVPFGPQTLNRAISTLADTGGLGYVPSPLITDVISETTRIPEGDALAMVNQLVAPYGYRAIVRKGMIEVFGGSIDAKLPMGVLTYKLKHINFAQIAAAPRSASGMNQTSGGGSSGTGGNGSAGGGGSLGGMGAGDSGGSGGSGSQVLAPRDLDATAVREFFGRIGALTLSGERAKIDYDAKTRTVIARDLEPYLYQLQQYLDQIDVPQKKVIIELKMVSVTNRPERNEGIDWSGFTSNLKASVYNTPAADAEAVAGAASSVLSGVVPDHTIDFTGFKSPGLRNMTLSLPELTATLNLIKKYADVEVMQKVTMEANDGMPAHTFTGDQLFIVVPGTQASGAGTSSQPLTFQPLVGDMITVTPEVNPASISLAFSLQSSRPGEDRPYAGNLYPQFKLRRTDQYISVVEGKTAVLSAYMQDQNSVQKTQVPYLSSIPLIGPRLFGSTRTSRERTVVLFLLTPRVIDAEDGDAMELLSQNIVRDHQSDPKKVNSYIWPEDGLRKPLTELSETKRERRKDPGATERILSSPVERTEPPALPDTPVQPARPRVVPVPGGESKTTVSLLRQDS